MMLKLESNLIPSLKEGNGILVCVCVCVCVCVYVFVQCMGGGWTSSSFFVFLFLSFCLFRAAPTAYRGVQSEL